MWKRTGTVLSQSFVAKMLGMCLLIGEACKITVSWRSSEPVLNGEHQHPMSVHMPVDGERK